MAEIDWTVVSRYAAGDCTADEQAQVERWLGEAPEYRAGLAAIGWVTTQARQTASPERRTAILAALDAKIAAAERPAWRRVPTMMRIAAAVVLTVGIPLGAYVALHRRAESVASSSPTMRTITTGRGERLALRLPDDTRVVLAPASTLRVPSTFGTRDRALELVGEAAFTVTHDERRPFTVRAGHVLVKDLGTEFIVRAYAGDSAVDVVVAEGVVAVASSASPGDSLVAKRGDRVHAPAGRELALTHDAPLEEYFGVVEGRLLFRRTPLREAIGQIERWYDVEIELASPGLGGQELTAAFREGESASQVLGALVSVFHVDVVQTGPRAFTLRAR